MAKQNFISGGYYGKLGDTVGQRWKNKRTIRTYVIPKNPRTEVQQANRARFANLVPYAQLGMSANKGVSAFIKEDVTEWQARMSACSYFYSLNYKELDLIPLYPQEYVVPYTVSVAKRTNKTKDTYQYLEVVGTLPTNTRSVSILAKYVKGAEKPSEVYLFEGVFEQQEGYNLKILLPSGLELTEDTKIRIISRDDVDSTTDMIASAMINVSKPDIIYLDFDTTVTSITHTGAVYSITTNQNFIEGTTVAEGITIKSVVRGQWQTYALTGTSIVNDNGYAKITGTLSNYDENNVPALPTGSQVYFGDISMSNEYYVISAKGITENYSNEDLTRNATVTFTKDAETTLAIGVQFSFGESGTSATLATGVNCTLAYNAPSLTVETASVTASIADTGNGTITIKSTKTNADYHCIKDCYVTIPDFTVKVLGVTYNISGGTIANYTNNAEKVEVVFNTAVTSVSHNGATYTIKTSQKWLDGTTTLGSSSIKSVVRGEWQTYALTSTSVANDNGYAKITGTLSNYDNANIPAFASGSAVNLGDISLITDIYNITASASTNSYSNTDLTRSASVSYTVDETTQQAFRLTFSFGGSNAMTMKTDNYKCKLWSIRLGIRNVYEDISAILAGTNSATRELTTTERAINWYCNTQSAITIPTFSIQVLGVTYNIEQVKDLPVKNGAEYGLVQGSMFEENGIATSTTETDSVSGIAYLKIKTPRQLTYTAKQVVGASASTYIDSVAETAEGEVVSDWSMDFDTDAWGDEAIWANFAGTSSELSEGLVYPIHVTEIDFVNNFLEVSWFGTTSRYKCTQKDELWIEPQ